MCNHRWKNCRLTLSMNARDNFFSVSEHWTRQGYSEIPTQAETFRRLIFFWRWTSDKHHVDKYDLNYAVSRSILLSRVHPLPKICCNVTIKISESFRRAERSFLCCGYANSIFHFFSIFLLMYFILKFWNFNF